MVERQLAGLDDNDARPGMGVPAERPAGCDLVLDDVDVGGALRVDAGLPVGRQRLGLEAVECSYPEVCALNAHDRRRQHGRRGVGGEADDCKG